jgi:hypothetical protein
MTNTNTNMILTTEQIADYENAAKAILSGAPIIPGTIEQLAWDAVAKDGDHRPSRWSVVNRRAARLLRELIARGEPLELFTNKR